MSNKLDEYDLLNLDLGAQNPRRDVQLELVQSQREHHCDSDVATDRRAENSNQEQETADVKMGEFLGMRSSIVDRDGWHFPPVGITSFSS
jgi:hypothetical protein